MTKEEIQHEYSKTVSTVGQDFYRLCVPALEILEKLKDLMRLNQAMHQILLKEKEEEKAAKALKVVGS